MPTVKHSDINWAQFVSLGKQLVGKPYRLGAETVLTDAKPEDIKAIDCSELVEWLYAQLKKIDGTPAEICMPDGSYNQAKICAHISKDKILIGDLAFKMWPDTGVIHHVGVYLGNEEILEAKGIAYGTIITSLQKFMESTHFAFFGRHPNILDA